MDKKDLVLMACIVLALISFGAWDQMTRIDGGGSIRTGHIDVSTITPTLVLSGNVNRVGGAYLYNNDTFVSYLGSTTYVTVASGWPLPVPAAGKEPFFKVSNCYTGAIYAIGAASDTKATHDIQYIEFVR